MAQHPVSSFHQTTAAHGTSSWPLPPVPAHRRPAGGFKHLQAPLQLLALPFSLASWPRSRSFPKSLGHGKTKEDNIKSGLDHF